MCHKIVVHPSNKAHLMLLYAYLCASDSKFRKLLVVGSVELPLNDVDAIFYLEVETGNERNINYKPFDVLGPLHVAASLILMVSC